MLNAPKGGLEGRAPQVRVRVRVGLVKCMRMCVIIVFVTEKKW